MLALVVALCAGQVLAVPNPEGPIFSSPALTGSGALFEFAPASGAGMGTACACTTPTSAKGDALTFTRTGDATCSKQGLATTGIANGDLVVCTANQPRVESSGGVLGLRVEGSRTNVLTRSSELDNAAWTLDFAGGGVIPTRTANAATAPDGTTSAERLQFSSCPTSGDSSSIYQLHATSGASASTVYCRGNASTQNISICSFGSGGSSGCSSVSCPSTSWSRVQDLRTATGTGGIVIGCNNSASYAGASNTGAADVFLWGAQQEMGSTYATSYIPTVAAGVTRNAEIPYFAQAVAATSGVCSSASVEVPALAAFAGGSGLYAPMLSSGSGSAVAPYVWPFTAAVGASLAIDGASSSGAPTIFSPATSNPTLSGRYVARHAGVKWQYCVNGSCTTHASDTTWLAPTYTHIKLDVNGSVVGSAIWTRVQVDPDSARCTP